MEPNVDTGGMIDIPTSDATDFVPVAAGEYQLQVLKSELQSGTSAKGNDWKAIKMTLDIVGEQTADYVYHMEFIPRLDGDFKQNEKSKKSFQRFKLAMGLGADDAFQAEDLVGAEPWAILDMESDPQYGKRNTVKRWVAGQGSNNAPGL